MLLAVMANLLPMHALIPVHGAVQMGSNVGRATLFIRNTNWYLLLWFGLGSALGALLGGQIAITLAVHYLQLILGLFIVFLVLKPARESTPRVKPNIGLLGFGSTLLTMFVGATGPFVMSGLKRKFNQPEDLVGTFSSCMVIQHGLKVAVFGFLGFAFVEYFLLIVSMIATGFIGTLLGRRFLLKLDKNLFTQVLNSILILLAARLIYHSLYMLSKYPPLFPAQFNHPHLLESIHD